MKAANENPMKQPLGQNSADEFKKHEAKGALSSEVAHDINNSLATIQTSLFILKNVQAEDKYREAVFENITEELKKIADSVNLISDIFDPDATVLKVVNLDAEVTRVLDLTRRRLKGKGISVTKKITSGLSPVMCSSSHIRQLLLNLIKNAEEALILAEEKDIVISTGEEYGFVRIEVKDTGSGMNKEVTGKLLSSSNNSAGKAGMGLAACRIIARKYGGDIMVRSEEGKGTTVTVTIPKG